MRKRSTYYFGTYRNRRGLNFLDAPFLPSGRIVGESYRSGDCLLRHHKRGRCCRDGILIAANGITGNPGQLTEAYSEIAVSPHGPVNEFWS